MNEMMQGNMLKMLLEIRTKEMINKSVIKVLEKEVFQKVEILFLILKLLRRGEWVRKLLF